SSRRSFPSSLRSSRISFLSSWISRRSCLTSRSWPHQRCHQSESACAGAADPINSTSSRQSRQKRSLHFYDCSSTLLCRCACFISNIQSQAHESSFIIHNALSASVIKGLTVLADIIFNIPDAIEIAGDNPSIGVMRAVIFELAPCLRQVPI